MQKNIAFFDFDGTITSKDTMLELAKFKTGRFSYIIGMFMLSPWLISMKLGIISKQTAKEKLLSYFFGDSDLQSFNNLCKDFSNKVIPDLIKKEAKDAIDNHLLNNTPVIIVSASAENWVAPWCISNNLQFICTRLKVKEHKITGKIEGKNCNEKEKVCRIKEIFNLTDFTTIYCYGDSKGDQWMLQIATHSFYRTFV